MKFKNILLYAALLSGMSFSSCTDFLDEDSNPNALSPGIFWKSEGDIMKGLTVYTERCSRMHLGRYRLNAT